MNYDKSNIFARIIRNELASEKIYEDEILLIIKDKFPDKKYKTHLLCLSKQEFIDFNDFVKNYDKINEFFQKIRNILNDIGITHYQLSTNNGERVGQEIMHFHLHIKSHDEIKN
jgi:histidine triad (HIT) family protein